MDGVLVDWLDGLRRHANKSKAIYDIFRTNPQLLCHDSIDLLYGDRDKLKEIQLNRPVEWWINLEFFPWARHLIATVKQNFTVAFLTSPGAVPAAAYAKVQWQLNNYPEIPMLISKHKYLAADPTKVLIDDDDWQLSKWKAAGGLAIRWPNQFELESKSLEHYTLPFIDKLVQEIKDYEQTI